MRLMDFCKNDLWVQVVDILRIIELVSYGATKQTDLNENIITSTIFVQKKSFAQNAVLKSNDCFFT